MKNDDILKNEYVKTIWNSKININEVSAYKTSHSALLESLYKQAEKIFEPSSLSKKNFAKDKERKRILISVFYGAGKAQFADPWAKKGLYQLLGIPEDVQDGRAMATYLEYIALCSSYSYTIEEFGSDRACIKIKRDSMQITSKQNPSPENALQDFDECLLCWESYLNGAVKTLLLPAWSVEVTDQPDDGIVKFEVMKKVDREQ